MTLNQILYFRKVARLENYHQAAEELYISQPSLSRSMAALESELGITLFEKKGRGVVLTNAGRLFLEHADRIAGDCDIAAGKMKELASGGGKINIGYIFPLAGHYIPHNVRTFLDQEENKNVAFSFWQNHTPAIAQKVKSGELDLGFGGFLKSDDMEYFPLLQQPLVIVSGAAWRRGPGAAADCRRSGGSACKAYPLSGDRLRPRILDGGLHRSSLPQISASSQYYHGMPG